MNINMLRAAFLAPAIADFYLAASSTLLMAEGSVLPSLRFSGVAFCWGILLLLGLRQPVARAWILWPTILVIGLVTLSAVAGYSAGEMPAVKLAISLMIGVMLILLCFAGLSHARRASASLSE